MRKKNLLFLIPIVVVSLVSFLIINFKESYSSDLTAVATTVKEKYYYIRRNMLSHHYITNNSDPSGTIMIKTGSTDQVDGEMVLTYCANKGKNIAKSRDGKYYENVPISQTSVPKIQEAEDNLTGIMLNSYPYISLAELKNKIKTGIGIEEYEKYEFDTLDVQEAMTATQAAVWNAIGDTTSNKYRTTGKIGSLKYANFHKGTNNARWSINWDSSSAYNITKGCYNGIGEDLNCGSKSTYLAPGDTTESVSSYKKKGTKNLAERINRLITWYKTLTKSSVSSITNVPKFQESNATWSNNGSTLSLTITTSDTTFDYETTNYNITFKDLKGKTLTNVVSTPIKNASEKITGYNYVVNDITTDGINLDIKCSIASVNQTVYIYEASNGYKNSQFLIGVEDGNIPVEQTISIINDPGKFYLCKKGADFEKTTISYGTTNETTGECLADASFIIYADDGKTIVKEFTTGKGAYYTDLAVGTYYLEEIDAPVGYVKDDNKYRFEVSQSNTVVNVNFKNEYTRLCIKKVSTTDKNQIIDGANISVESMLGGVYETFTSSEQEGLHCLVGQLPSGYYYIVENEAPTNYFKTNNRYRVKVGDFSEDDIAEEQETEDNVIALTLINNVATIENTPSISLSKSDITNGACVSGAKLVVKNSTGKIVDEWTSSCVEGKDTYQLNLDPGNYILEETLAPVGYATAETIEFTVNNDGSVNKNLNMKDAPINVCILKKGDDTKKGLAGAEFEIYKEDGTLYEKFTSTTTATCFFYMPVGKYTIKETKAPKGYEISKETTTIEVKDTSETQNFEIYNELIVPKTAMDASRMVIIIATIFMIFGIGLVGYYGYKKHN